MNLGGLVNVAKFPKFVCILTTFGALANLFLTIEL